MRKILMMLWHIFCTFAPIAVYAITGLGIVLSIVMIILSIITKDYEDLGMCIFLCIIFGIFFVAIIYIPVLAQITAVIAVLLLLASGLCAAAS